MEKIVLFVERIVAIAELHPTLKNTEFKVLRIGCHLERREAKVRGSNKVPEQGPQVVQLLRPLGHSLIDQANQLLELVDACQPIERSLWL